MFIRKKMFEEMADALEKAIAANDELSKRAFLTDISTEQRCNVFTFVRNGEIIQVRTFHMINDDLTEWTERLLK